MLYYDEDNGGLDQPAEDTEFDALVEAFRKAMLDEDTSYVCFEWVRNTRND